MAINFSLSKSNNSHFALGFVAVQGDGEAWVQRVGRVAIVAQHPCSSAKLAFVEQHFRDRKVPIFPAIGLFAPLDDNGGSDRGALRFWVVHAAGF